MQANLSRPCFTRANPSSSHRTRRNQNRPSWPIPFDKERPHGPHHPRETPKMAPAAILNYDRSSPRPSANHFTNGSNRPRLKIPIRDCRFIPSMITIVIPRAVPTTTTTITMPPQRLGPPSHRPSHRPAARANRATTHPCLNHNPQPQDGRFHSGCP